ncbi:MAG: alpha-2-macroglobulin family protein, partial [Pseudomonadota bacterium]
KVRLMAMAWSEAKLGHASRDVIVRDPIAVTVSAPRFLTLGDRADVRVDVHNVDGPEGAYTFSVDRTVLAGEAKTVADRKVALKPGERKPEMLTLAPETVGLTTYAVNVTGPDDIIVSRTLQIDVKPPAGDIKRTTVSTLQPGGTLSLSSDLMQDLIASRSTLNVSVGTVARFDVPGLLIQLDRYPFGCAEQTVSRALPLVYANAVAANVGIATDAAIRKRVQAAVDRVFQMQDSSGAFGTWSPSYGDMWLTAYVTDFLSRARENGYKVPERGYAQALDRLQNYVAYAQDFQKGGETRAYALYVLARNKRAPAGELRYYVDERLSRFATPLAKAQLGAALAMVGDQDRASRAFGAAIADVQTAHAALTASPASNQSLVTFARNDYGSMLRDGAAVLALAGETKLVQAQAASLKDVVAARFESRRYTSTQEQAWMLLAAHALGGEKAAVTLEVDGTKASGQLNRSYDAGDLARRTIKIANTGAEPVDAVISVMGASLTPEPEISKGFKVARRMFTLDGAALDLSDGEVAQNTRAVIVLDVTTESPGGRVLVVDRLPAGFEIENPRLVSSGDVKALSWLKTKVNPEHTEFRDDRFVAAFNLNGQYGGDAKPSGTTMSMAYIVRAVTPGTYLQPGATVEDMYRPEAYARTAAQMVRVAPHVSK